MKNIKTTHNCCPALEIASDGGTNDWQWTRLGVYYLDGESAKGRPQYKKPKDQFAAEYLYFLSEYGLNVWYVGETAGINLGGMINHDSDTLCPTDLKEPWYYYNWDEEINDWALDENLVVRCLNDPPPTSAEPATTTKPPPTSTSPERESCTWGAWCDDCSVTAVYAGVRYCCTDRCNSGGIEIAINGEGNVECFCYH